MGERSDFLHSQARRIRSWVGTTRPGKIKMFQEHTNPVTSPDFGASLRTSNSHGGSWWNFALSGQGLLCNVNPEHHISDSRLSQRRSCMATLEKCALKKCNWALLKSRDITLLTKVHIIKVMAFPVVMFGYESCTIG